MFPMVPDMAHNGANVPPSGERGGGGGGGGEGGGGEGGVQGRAIESSPHARESGPARQTGPPGS